jgi:hypothetical protein
MSKSIIINNSGIPNVDFSGMSLVGKYIETKNGIKGIVVREWLCYPEPSEWVLANGIVITEETLHYTNDNFIIIKFHEGAMKNE